MFGEELWTFVPRELARAKHSSWHKDTTVRVMPSEDGRYLFAAYRGRGISGGVLVYVIEPDSGALVWHTKVGSEADRVQLTSHGHKLRVHVRSHDAQQMWTVELDPDAKAITGMTSVPHSAREVRFLPDFQPDARHDSIVFGADRRTLVARSFPVDGPARISGPNQSWSLALAEQYVGSPDWLDDGRAVVPNYNVESTGVTLTALAPMTGELSWTTRVQGVGTLGEPVDGTKLRVSTTDQWIVVEGTQGDTSFLEVLEQTTGATVLHQVYPGS